MIHRSGLSARSLSPTSAATSRTWATNALSSVSGIVKNCGAWGSMAPPITVDIMVDLLCRETIARGGEQQAQHFTTGDGGQAVSDHAAGAAVADRPSDIRQMPEVL